MKRLLCILLSLAMVVCFAVVSGLAAEHPGASSIGHGSSPGQPVGEHPGEHKEHPGETEMLSAGQIIDGIKAHITAITQANEGFFTVYDSEENKHLRLKLVRIHEDKVSYIKKDDVYFACTDFIAEDGKTGYDVDFWMKRASDNGLEVYQTKIHKKDGKPRFTYKDDEIVPVE